MRARACFGLVALTFGLMEGQVRPPGSRTQEIQGEVEDRALKSAEDLMRRLKDSAGTLSLEAMTMMARWDQAVRLWKQEPGAGAAPLLAEGVLFDCLSRLHAVRTLPVGEETKVPFSDFADLAKGRPKRAARAFEAALKLDSGLVEAQMRLARIRAPEDRRSAQLLERLAEQETNSTIPYLAAMSRAEVARTGEDLAMATRWYERALALHPGSTAATIALGAIRPEATLSFADLDASDPYYSYPCAVLTPGIGTELSERVRTVVFR